VPHTEIIHKAYHIFSTMLFFLPLAFEVKSTSGESICSEIYGDGLLSFLRGLSGTQREVKGSRSGTSKLFVFFFLLLCSHSVVVFECS
jgi:hypothetical protein